MTLEHLAPYLPYDLKVSWRNIEDGLVIVTMDVDGRESRTLSIMDVIELGHKPILRPLSDLTKPITVEGYNSNGEFIPIEKLNWVYQGIGALDIDGDDLTVEIPIPGSQYTSEREDSKEWLWLRGTLWPIYQTLFRWHFDVFGLIEKNEAIDINTLP